MAIIEGDLIIRSCPALTDIEALANIAPDALNALEITNCTMLGICNILSICNYLAKENATADISGNASGCASYEEVTSACMLVNTENVRPEVVHIHPNPTNGRLTVKGLSEGRIRIVDQFGRVLREQSMHNQEIDISNYPAGLYFIQLVFDHHWFSSRIIKK